jgi:hypothetical protein
LTPPAARCFGCSACTQAPTSPPPASLAGQPLRDTRRLLIELARVNLITQHILCRYTLHDLLRAYATDLVVTPVSSSGVGSMRSGR